MAEAAEPKIDLDDKAAQGFGVFLKTLPEKPDTLIRFFDRGDYFTVHGPDALFAAKEVFHTMGVVKYLGADRIPSVAIRQMLFESMLRDLLLVRQYRVEVYESKGGKTNQWRLTKKGSPGNLQMFEDDLFEHAAMSANSFIIAAKVSNTGGQRIVGAAFADVTLYKMHVAEFADNDQFSNFEALLVQIGAKECMLAADPSNADAAKMTQLVARAGVLLTERKKSEFHTKDITQDLDRLLRLPAGVTSANLPESSLEHAMAAWACLVSGLQLLGNEDNFHRFTLQRYDLTQYMRLDGAAVRALSITPSPFEAASKAACLSGLLNKCKTAQGSRMLLQWMKQPLLDPARIGERLDVVEAMVAAPEIRSPLRDSHLQRLPDLDRIGKKLHRSSAGLQDCVRVYQAVKHLPEMATLLESFSGAHSPVLQEMFITPLRQLSTDLSKYQEMIEQLVDLERAAQHEYVVLPTCDASLQTTRDEMDKLYEKMSNMHQRAARTLGLDANKTLKLEEDSKHGYVLRVTRKEEKGLRGNKDFIVLETQKAGVKFTTHALRETSAEYRQLHQSYEETQKGIVKDMIVIAAGYAQPLSVLNDLVATMDVLLSFAHVSATASGTFVRPIVRPSGGDIKLTQARHPCVEGPDGQPFIANDAHLTRGSSEVLLITGPNMGGKSTYIRQIGVIVLLAQMGCFVPAESAEISVVDAILARVGAGDNQLKGVSTFMAEMLETAAILKAATPNSLIIIDELGRGTSTHDGLGLAWAIAEHIAVELKSLCLFATHFHELTALAGLHPTVKNAHVAALVVQGVFTLLYKVKAGPCDQSFGIHVAVLADFPKEVIELAKRKADELEDFDRPDAKYSREERLEGEAAISEFLQGASTLSDDGAESLAGLHQLYEKLQAKGNKYIAEVLQQS